MRFLTENTHLFFLLRSEYILSCESCGCEVNRSLRDEQLNNELKCKTKSAKCNQMQSRFSVKATPLVKTSLNHLFMTVFIIAALTIAVSLLLQIIYYR